MQRTPTLSSYFLSVPAAFYILQAPNVTIHRENRYSAVFCQRSVQQLGLRKGIVTEVVPEKVSELQNEIKAFKAKNKELRVTIRELRLDLERTKTKLADAEDRYERLLGRYQQDVSAKIIHF